MVTLQERRNERKRGWQLSGEMEKNRQEVPKLTAVQAMPGLHAAASLLRGKAGTTQLRGL